MPSRNSSLARGLEPFISGLWIFFVLASLLVAAVWAFGIGEGSLERSISNTDLRVTLAWLLTHMDLAWITLAAANVYLALTRSVGLDTARRWGLITLGGVVAMAWLSAVTGFPLGPIRYGTPLGLKLGPVPLGLALLWFTIILSARETVLRFFPRVPQGGLAAGVGLVALLTDLNLESVAAKWRGFWFWRGGGPTEPPVFDAPLTSHFAWGILAILVTFFLRESNVVSTAQKRLWQPTATLAIFEGILLLTNVTHRLSH
ncbi:MAG TPA: carotenoid biosynthesis protein [Chthoniobacter sp.]|nr:carotenoid biosynthesis protein [Chthoniobacter sp.]